MQVEKIQTIKDLVLKLKQNPILRYCCGFNILGQVPSESTFSRFINRLTETEELENLFYQLVLQAKELNIVDGDHISIDSTKLDSYEAAKPKKSIVDDGTNPNWGMKRDTNGNNIRWFGWKLHILCDSKSELPLDILVTPASIYDGTVAISLIEQFFNNYKDTFKPTYYSMDSGYDFEYIYSDIISKFDGIPIIFYNPRRSYAPPEGLDDNFDPICSAGYKLVYWGKDGNYLKFRCPHAVGECNCPFAMN
ncbi:transposase [Alkaliphilus sp. B6464]|uniref:transposase n=1 Tax=Alkaliphilus sp. B6464 TaxID=2731219 RepID=UPI001BA6DEE2|nr:transposase [Alkaliphilus sp. B6464]QUH19530.1 transposase [Alkaliphilus sp. B6464]